MHPQTRHPNSDYPAGYAVVDLETTGLSNADRIVEIGVVLLRPDLTAERTWETLIQPERDSPNSYIHKITATDVVDAPTFAEVAAYFGSLLHGRILVAHNASFEHRFPTNEFNRARAHNGLCQPWLDTMKLAKQHLGCVKLSDALTATNINNSLAHSALADAQATANLLRHLHLHCGADVSATPRPPSPPRLLNAAPCHAAPNPPGPGNSPAPCPQVARRTRTRTVPS